MNVAYTPSSEAETLSRLLWSLTDPNPTRGTVSLFPVVEATDKSTWLMVDKSFSIPVHPFAVLGGIADILKTWVTNGKLPPDTITVLADLVGSKRGQRLVVWDAFPQLFKDMSLSHGQMIELGKLPG